MKKLKDSLSYKKKITLEAISAVTEIGGAIDRLLNRENAASRTM